MTAPPSMHRHTGLQPSGWSSHSLPGHPSREARRLFTFGDRRTAGRMLAEWIGPLAGPDSMIVAIAGGGIHVAAEVAHAFGVPLRAIVVEPIAVPGYPCAALGAIAEDGTQIVEREMARRLRIPAAKVNDVIARQRPAIERRAMACHGGQRDLGLAGRHVVLIDEALDSGVVALTAARSLRQHQPASIVVAVPVGSRPAVDRVGREADDVVAMLAPFDAGARRSWYRTFPPVSDADVAETLALG